MSVGHGYRRCPDSLRKVNALSLGCGWTRKQSNNAIRWTHCDSAKEVCPDVVWKAGITKAPFENDEFDHIESIHSFEHLPNHVFALEEMYRITRDGGVWKIVVPFGWSWQDNLFHETMGYHWGSFNKFFPNTERKYYSKVKLEPLRIYAESCGVWKYCVPYFLRRFLSKYLNNVFYQITFELIVRK